MRQIVIAAVSCASVGAQEATLTDVFQKAPPEVDQALRDQIAKFYDAHVTGKFRAAEQYVAPDSRDLFYESDHQKYLAFEVAKIEYSDNFTKAKVITAVELDWRTPRMGVIRVKPPLPSTWKLEEGKWYWYTVPRKDWDTPWGTMKPGADNPAAAMAGAFTKVTPGQVQALVRVNKGVVSLSSYEKSHDTVELQNGLPGEITLRVDAPAMPGLAVNLDKTKLKEGETASLMFDYDPPVKNPKATTVVDLHVEPTGQNLALRVVFAVPPEVEQQLKRKR